MGQDQARPVAPEGGQGGMRPDIERRFRRGVQYNMRVVIRGDSAVGKTEVSGTLSGGRAVWGVVGEDSCRDRIESQCWEENVPGPGPLRPLCSCCSSVVWVGCERRISCHENGGAVSRLVWSSNGADVFFFFVPHAVFILF